MSQRFTMVEREGHVTIITLNRPEVLNALHAPANREMEAIFDDFADDPDQWVAIVTGAGERAFCAGNDLKHQAAGGEMTLPRTGLAGLTHRFGMNKPLIAAVNGVATGGGFELALCCDIVIASENASFGLLEPRVGLIAGAGGVQRLPRMIGMQRAMSIILTARLVSAREAEAFGIATAVTTPEALLETARQWARLICENSPLAVRASKEAALRCIEEPTVAEALKRSFYYPAFETLMTSEDSVEGPLAFSQKRKPNWTGRQLPGGRWSLPRQG